MAEKLEEKFVSMNKLKNLFIQLANLIDGPLPIQKATFEELQVVIKKDIWPKIENPELLPNPFLKVMSNKNANHICKTILNIPFKWKPPRTSITKLYREHSKNKVHVELLGPNGLLDSNKIRMGLYGMLPHTEYGIRTHIAEEMYVIIAGESYWMVGNNSYKLLKPGDQSFHKSKIFHSTLTVKKAFMSIYFWSGNISTKSYVYLGLPKKIDKFLS